MIHNLRLGGKSFFATNSCSRRPANRTLLSIMAGLVAFLAVVCALAQEPAQTIHGTWIATAGRGQTLHGTWTGSALPGHPDAAEGTWTLASGGRMVIQGTWRAQKSRQRWEGDWTAQTARGESLAGSWGADVEHWQGKTFQELLELTLQQEVSGWWQVGQRQGNWWLKGSPQRVR
ncbi:MAG: hypothetical protein WB819_17165 [Terriglobia bacterium]